MPTYTTILSTIFRRENSNSTTFLNVYARKLLFGARLFYLNFDSKNGKNLNIDFWRQNSNSYLHLLRDKKLLTVKTKGVGAAITVKLRLENLCSTFKRSCEHF